MSIKGSCNPAMSQGKYTTNYRIYHPINVRRAQRTNPGTIPHADTDGEVGRQAFNDLALIASRVHIRLSQFIEDKYVKLWEFGAWAAGMPAQAVVRPEKNALIIMNAGEGIGLGLTVRFAEAGYTVFGIIHKGRTSDEPGSAGELAYIWKQRQALLAGLRESEVWPHGTRPELGDVIPMLLAPMSPASQSKVKRSISAYCTANGLRLHAIIMTPVFPSSTAVQAYVDSCPPRSLVPPSSSYGIGSETKLDWLGSALAAEEEPVYPSSLHKHPSFTKHPDYESGSSIPPAREGSFVPLSIAHQDVVQRVIERETTEQLAVAQSFHELLLTSPYYGNDKSNPSGLIRRKEVAAQRKRRRWPFIPTSEPQLTNDEYPCDDDLFEGDNTGTTLGYTWLTGGILLFLIIRLWSTIIPTWNRRFNGPRVRRTRAPPQLGRIVWLTGCSESTFGEARSLGAVMDDARAKIGGTMSRELGDLGVHVSTVEAGPLDYRACNLANFVPPDPAWNPRTSLSINGDTRVPDHFRASWRRVRFLARLSALWALDESSCFWIVQRAVETRFPKPTYRLGLDVLVRRITQIIPNSAFELGAWILYERMGGRMWEEVLLHYDTGAFWTWVPGPISRVVLRSLASSADKIRRRERLYH